MLRGTIPYPNTNKHLLLLCLLNQRDPTEPVTTNPHQECE
jgi:hypothetical protein